MDIFTDFMGVEWNLDDLTIYPAKWKEMNIHDFFNFCTKKAGDSLFYMDFLHTEVNWWAGQKERVTALCKELSGIWHNIRKWNITTEKHTLINEDEYRLALMKWLWRFEDETENQC